MNSFISCLALVNPDHGEATTSNELGKLVQLTDFSQPIDQLIQSQLVKLCLFSVNRIVKSLFEIYICTNFSKILDMKSFWRLVDAENQVKTALKILDMAQI